MKQHMSVDQMILFRLQQHKTHNMLQQVGQQTICTVVQRILQNAKQAAVTYRSGPRLSDTLRSALNCVSSGEAIREGSKAESGAVDDDAKARQARSTNV